MRTMGRFSQALIVLGCLGSSVNLADAADLLPKPSLDRLGVQAYWEGRVPLAKGESIRKAVILDDNLYLLTNVNRVYTVHVATGVLRWTSRVAETGQTLRGPTHSDQYVFFTAPGSVKVLDRRTGELAGEPRKLRGFVIEVAHDIATISIGEVHGVRADDILDVVRVNEEGDVQGGVLARLRVTVVGRWQSKGRLIRPSRSVKIHAGNRVMADVILPLESVKLPFAASSPAVADDKDLFVGAGNQRFYSLDILSGFQNWQIMTPKTVSSTPVLRGENLYIAGQDGRVISLTQRERMKNWIYQTEGPIFADLVVGPRFVYVVSTDRLLYCLNRETGRRVWRKRFDNPPTEAPRLAQGRAYQRVPNEGLIVLDAAKGNVLWQRPGGGQFLAQFGRDGYLALNHGAIGLVRLDAATGRRKVAVGAPGANFAVASQTNQLIILVGRLGQMLCMRPKNAPRLRPADLAQVLRDDRKIAAYARLAAKNAAETKAKAKKRETAPSRPNLDFLDEDDWLASHSTAKPVGGSGLVEVEGEPAAQRKQVESRKTDETEKKAEDGEDEGDEEDEDLDDEDLDDEDDSNDDDSGDDDDDDDSGDDGDEG